MGTRMLNGHCRFATHGDYRNNANNHPHPADGGWIVHNGMIPHHKQVIDKNGLLAQTDCDLEVLGLLIESQSGTLQERCRKAVERAAPSRSGRNLFSAESPLVMLGLWSRPGRLIAVRRSFSHGLVQQVVAIDRRPAYREPEANAGTVSHCHFGRRQLNA